METTYIDDIASDWVADIEGKPVRLSTNGASNSVVLPGAEMMPSDLVIDRYTPEGKTKFDELIKRGYKEGEATKELVLGIDFHRITLSFTDFRKEYGEPFADKDLYGRNNPNQPHPKSRRYVQQNPSHLFR